MAGRSDDELRKLSEFIPKMICEVRNVSII